MLQRLSATVLVLALSLAQPAFSQPAARPENWVALPANDSGAQGWLDMGNMVVNAQFRIVPFRFRNPSGGTQDFWIEADCQRSGTRFLERIDWTASGAPAPVPASEWQYVEPNTPLIAGHLLRALCV